MLNEKKRKKKHVLSIITLDGRCIESGGNQHIDDGTHRPVDSKRVLSRQHIGFASDFKPLEKSRATNFLVPKGEGIY